MAKSIIHSRKQNEIFQISVLRLSTIIMFRRGYRLNFFKKKSRFNSFQWNIKEMLLCNSHIYFEFHWKPLKQYVQQSMKRRSSVITTKDEEKQCKFHDFTMSHKNCLSLYILWEMEPDVVHKHCWWHCQQKPKNYTVELQWLEHWWLVYHSCIELICESLLLLYCCFTSTVKI